MSVPTIRVPVPLASDPSEVNTALEVAGALWEKENSDEAIRWVKRAVEAAAEAGDSARSETLGHALMELESAARHGASADAASPVAPLGPSEPAPTVTDSPPIAPFAHAAPSDSASTAAVATNVVSDAPWTTPSLPPVHASVASKAPGATSSAPRAATPAVAGGIPRSSVGAGPHGASPGPVGAGADVALPPGSRIRVSIKTSVRDPNLLVVRPLAEGRATPPGTQVGWLVLGGDEADPHHSNGSATS
jgi:hypothetical protein